MGKSKKTTKNTLPKYMRDSSREAVGMATNLARREYTGFGDENRTAGLSENEQLGIEGFRGEQGRYDEDFDKARGALDKVGSFTDEGVREKYMNPYIEGVLQPTARRRDRAFGEQMAELNRTEGMRSAFGGRKRVSQSLLNQQNQEGMDDLYSAGYGTAFDKATQLHGKEQDRQLALAGEYGDNAKRQAATNSMALRDLMESGFVDRSVDQSRRDFRYMEFLEERDWDVGNLSNLVNTIAAVPHESGTEVTTAANPVKTLMGVATIATGAIMIGMGNPMGAKVMGAGASMTGSA